LGPCQRARDVLIDLIVQDAVSGLVVGRVLGHERIKGALCVQHHRGERAFTLEAVALEEGERNGLLAGPHLVESEAIGEAPRRVDGEAEDFAALHRSMHGHGRRCRGLSDSAAADGYHHTVTAKHVRETHCSATLAAQHGVSISRKSLVSAESLPLQP